MKVGREDNAREKESRERSVLKRLRIVKRRSHPPLHLGCSELADPGLEGVDVGQSAGSATAAAARLAGAAAVVLRKHLVGVDLSGRSDQTL